MGMVRGEAVRPSGAPMVPMPQLRPGDGGGADAPSTQVAEAGKELAGEARAAGDRLAGEARERVRSEVDRRSTSAGERVQEAAGDVRGVAEHLRGQGREGPARVAEEAAERIERFAAYLRDSDTDTILADARDLGRRRPAAVVAGAAVLGIVAGRLVRASGTSGSREVSR
jgi:hypothetical protein